MMKSLGELLILGSLFLLHVRTGHADHLLVDCPPQLRPALATWADWRSRQGHSVELVDLETLRPRPAERPVGPTALILVGDGSRVGRSAPTVAAQVVSKYGPERLLLSDHGLARAVHADTVARLPFGTASELSSYLARVIQRERRRPGWDDLRLQITAGTGGFSPLIDNAIEMAATRLVRDLTPPTWEITLRRAAEPASALRGRGGIWVWLGHGQRDRLPGVERAPVARLAGGADVAVLLACYAGDFSSSDDCVAEQLLKSDDGPIAVIASTRVSMPYGNARLGGELLLALGSQPNRSLGRVFACARASSLPSAADERLTGLDSLAGLLGGQPGLLPAERWDHALMYHVLGDPCCLGDRSMPLAVQVEDGETPEGPITLRGVAPFDGRLLVRKGSSDCVLGQTTPRRVTRDEAFAVSLTLPEDLHRKGGALRVAIEGEAGLVVAALEKTPDTPGASLAR